MTFSEWIAKRGAGEWEGLRTYATLNLQNVPSEASAETAIKNDLSLKDEERKSLISQLVEVWPIYEREQVRHPTPEASSFSSPGEAHSETKDNSHSSITEKAASGVQSMFANLWANLPFLLMGLIVILAVAILGFILWPRGTLLESLGRTEVARGLITFVFAFGVIFVTLILIISLFGMRDPDIGAKFDRAKELFTAMIAVLGTIMGFYFGQADQQQATSDSDAEVAQISAALEADQTSEEKLSAIQSIISPTASRDQ